MDNRGTGRSEPILCRPLQSYKGNYVDAVGRCGRQLGGAADLYGSGNAADDLTEVLDKLGIDRVHLYGDSYGTFFSQTFAVRHPDRLHSVVLDAAYFVAGTDPFYIDTNRALRDAFRLSCDRSPTCAARPGTTMDRIERLTERLRDEPIVGRAQNADGAGRRVRVGVGGLIYLVTSAATSPTLYRELDAAVRAALRPRSYVKPLLRLAREWVTSPVEYFTTCLKWPRPSRVDPPVPPGADFPDTPVLVLAGDLDSLTSLYPTSTAAHRG